MRLRKCEFQKPCESDIKASASFTRNVHCGSIERRFVRELKPEPFSGLLRSVGQQLQQQSTTLLDNAIDNALRIDTLQRRWRTAKPLEIRGKPEHIGIDAGKRGLERTNRSAVSYHAQGRREDQRAQPFDDSLDNSAVQKRDTAPVVFGKIVEERLDV